MVANLHCGFAKSQQVALRVCEPVNFKSQLCIAIFDHEVPPPGENFTLLFVMLSLVTSPHSVICHRSPNNRTTAYDVPGPGLQKASEAWNFNTISIKSRSNVNVTSTTHVKNDLLDMKLL